MKITINLETAELSPQQHRALAYLLNPPQPKPTQPNPQLSFSDQPSSTPSTEPAEPAN